MNAEKRTLIKEDGLKKTNAPPKIKNRFFKRACAPILVAALAVGSLATGCESKEKAEEARIRAREAKISAQEAAKTEENVALVKAADRNNLKRVKKALDEGADPRVGEPWGSPLLFPVCKLGRLKIAEELINRGAKVNYSDGRRTALTLALENGHFKTAKMLIEKGANVNLDSRDGMPLTIAIRKKNLELVKLLVEKGAGIDNSQGGRATEFLVAVQVGNLEIVRYLYAKGADANAKLNEKSAITLAIQNENYGIAEFLIDNRQFVHGIQELREAARKGRLGLAKKLVAKEADFTVFSDVETPLMAAAEAGHVGMVRYLLEEPLIFNAINAEDEKGETALMKAAGAGKLEVVRLLVKEGADLNEKDDKGRTALAHAERHGHKSTYDFLISKGAKY